MDIRHAGGRGVSGLTLPRWTIGVGLACLMAAGTIRLWPAAEPIDAQPPSTARYSGSMLEPARSGITPMPSLRLVSVGGADAVSASEVAAPNLVGVITAGGTRAAYLRSAESGAVERVAVGGELDGWRVVAVTAANVTLEQDGRLAQAGLFAIR